MLTTALVLCLTQVSTWHTADTIQNGGDARLLDVGDRTPETTELAFTAPTDDVTLRVWDQWEQPKSVPCVVDGLEVSERTS